MTEPSQRRRDVLISLCLVAVTILVYGPVRLAEFINFDDTGYVTQNQHVQGGLTLRGLAWAFTATEQANWHPLTWLSHMLDCQLFGLNSGTHHAVSVLFHMANTLLLFFVWQRMTAAPWPSALVAALFAWHPLHVESVAWVAERKDVLSGLFWMLTLWAYVRYVEGFAVHGSRFRVYYGLALLFFALGLMAKPTLVTLPFVLLLLDYWPLGRTPWAAAVVGGRRPEPVGRLLAEKILFFLLAVASCAVTFWVQQGGKAVVPLADLSIGQRVGGALVAYVQYVGKAVWPVALAVFYPHRAWPWGATMGAGAVLVLVTGLVFWRASRAPHWVVGWLWYLGTLVPMIGLVQVGSQSMADRYTYIPLIGLFLMIGWSLPRDRVDRRIRRAAVAITAAVLTIFAVLAHRQVFYWQTSETLFGHAAKVTKDSPLAHLNLGHALSAASKTLEAAGKVQEAARKVQEAEAEYREALRVNPNYLEAHNNLGLTLDGVGRSDEAIAEYREALRIDPLCAEVHNNLGNVLVHQGRLVEAAAEYQEALWINPLYVEAHSNLGLALAGLGRIEEAMAEYAKALVVNPGYADAHYSLGVLLASQGKMPEALTAYREAVRLNARSTRALAKLAWLEATHEDPAIRRGNEAVRVAEQLCLLTGYQSDDALMVLAAAYAEAGRFGDAVQAAQKAIELARNNGKQDLAAKIEEQLKLYQAGRPYHERPASVLR